MNYVHGDLAKGRWNKFSLVEQMSNVGSEIFRTISWREKNKNNSEAAFFRALELLIFTLQDPKNKGGVKEIARVKEMLVDWYLGSRNYISTDEEWMKYFNQFNIAARLSN
ncbi:MAG: hypothetical protein KGD64_15430 [Candidatus Heimdallarchaeota archaeon]|nr:hypothetical protein [Candidatus Heimdallarchaeota archaeon]